MTQYNTLNAKISKLKCGIRNCTENVSSNALVILMMRIILRINCY